MTRTPAVQFLSIIFLLAIVVFFPSLGTAQPMDTPASTPAGIMLVEVHREEGFSSDQYFWTRLGDAAGATLFYFSGQNKFSRENFNPLKADEAAVAFDDW